MTKKLIIAIVILFPSFLFGQGYSNQDKSIINVKIDTLLQNYFQKAGLTLPGGSKRNDKVVADLRGMIKTDAEIFDDINATFNPKTRQYELKNKSRNTYIEDLVDNFPKGLIIINKNININYNDFDKGEVTVALERSIQGTNSDKFTLKNEDTLLITVGILPDKSVKIINISKIGSHIICMNDEDIDGVIDELDECSKEPGLISLNGCPDNDLDGIPNKRDQCPNESGPESNGGCPPSTFSYQLVFSGGVGYMFNRNILESAIATKDLSGYESVDGVNSKLGTIVNPDSKAALQLFANVAYYFGKNKSNKTTGISLGVSYLNYSANYGLGNLKVFYKGTDSQQQNFHQIVTSNNFVENINFNIINFPLMLRYKKKVGFLAAEIAFGPSLLFVNSSSEKKSGSFNFEAIYENSPNGSHSYSEVYVQSPTDWLITEAYIKTLVANNNSPDAKKELADLNNLGYNVGLVSENNKSGTIQNKVGLSLNITADIFYHITPKSAIKFGGSFIYSKINHTNNNYSIVNKFGETSYNSIYNSGIKSTYIAYGFNAGIIIGLNVKKH